MSKGAKIGNYVGTGLLSALMLMSAGMYFGNNAEIVKEFTRMEFPTWIIYPLGVAKILGVATLWFVKNKRLKMMAYAGFFFNILLAFGAHIGVGDGPEGWSGAAMGLVFWVLSFLFAIKTEKV